MKRVWRFIFSRTFFFGLMALVQLAVFTVLVMFFSKIGAYTYTIFNILAVLIVVGVAEKDDINPAYKITWILLVVALPFSGVLFYILFGSRGINPKKAKQLAKIEQNVSSAMINSGEVSSETENTDKSFARCTHYLSTVASAPLYPNTQSEYLPWGEVFFERFLQEVGKAEKSIFMEYFIIEDGIMWDKTLELLTSKAAQGVDVRIIYDSFGCIVTLPDRYEDKLRKLGIKCEIFNPLRFSVRPSDYSMLNHRDHRKITVIDGEVGFTGGVNFADEYINATNPYGKWKDTALMLKGPGVYSLTVTFLKMWDFITKSQTKYTQYIPKTSFEADGYVQPYCDSPIDNETVSEYTYLNVLQRAQDYVYIATPYLVIDNEMLTALCLAAKSGIDVRLITPGVPDKWYVYYVTQSYYPALIKAGVRIFEYQPGFIHAKMYVSDDKVAIVGSANMDYRSLYLHFENCCAFYGGHMATDVCEDLRLTMSQCREVSLEDTKKTPVYKRIMQIALRFIAPLM
ncbi:MAG: cardiolipin synthase [Oscillospiraceae bacterium]